MERIVFLLTALTALHGFQQAAVPGTPKEPVAWATFDPPKSPSPEFAMTQYPPDKNEKRTELLEKYQSHSYQHDNFPIEEFEEEKVKETVFCGCNDTFESSEIYRLIYSAVNLGTILILMDHIKGICSSELRQLFLLLLGIPGAISLGIEFIFPLLILAIGRNNDERFPHINKRFECAKFALVLTKTIGLLIPENTSASSVTEMCAWTGQTLFESPRWFFFGMLASILLIVLPLIQVGIHRYHNAD